MGKVILTYHPPDGLGINQTCKKVQELADRYQLPVQSEHSGEPIHAEPGGWARDVYEDWEASREIGWVFCRRRPKGESHIHGDDPQEYVVAGAVRHDDTYGQMPGSIRVDPVGGRDFSARDTLTRVLYDSGLLKRFYREAKAALSTPTGSLRSWVLDIPGRKTPRH